MRRRVALCSALIAVGASPAHAAERRVIAVEPRVLVVSEARAFVHDSIPAAKAFFDGLGEAARGTTSSS